MIIRGDCLEAMRAMPDGSVSAVVTDPPYALEFMGKDWDRLGKPKGFRRQANPADVGRDNVFGRSSRKCPEYAAGSQMQEWHEAWAKEALRVTKPGGILLAFGGTRTFHRLTCAIEDAGWEIRDCLMWLYGSGFPKSMDISKALDKAAGAVRETGPVDPERAGRLVNQRGNYTTDAGWSAGSRKVTVDPPATDAARSWSGWGTALKPAWEPIILARKPLVGTVAANVLAHGTGALNIDACRIDLNGDYKSKPNGRPSLTGLGDNYDPTKANQPDTVGRWPANVILDEEAGAALDAQTGTLKSGARSTKVLRGSEKTNDIYGEGFAGYGTPAYPVDVPASEGGASRFFYCAKSSKAERGEGNGHPTVKPIALMRWLVRLVKMPQGAVVLDPFMGSGTTGVACALEGVEFVGVERESEYADVAERRIAAASEER